MPLPTCRLAMLTTRRRLDSMSFCLAASSWRSMRLGQRDLLDAGQQRHLAHLVEVQAHGVAAHGLHREIQLDRGLGVVARVVARSGHDVGLVLDDLDAHVGEREEQFLELRDRDLDVLQSGHDLRAAQAAQLVPLLDEADDFGAVDERDGGDAGLVW